MKSKKNDEQVSITKRWELDGLPKITPKKSTKNGKKNLSKQKPTDPRQGTLNCFAEMKEGCIYELSICE